MEVSGGNIIVERCNPCHISLDQLDNYFIIRGRATYSCLVRMRIAVALRNPLSPATSGKRKICLGRGQNRGFRILNIFPTMYCFITPTTNVTLRQPPSTRVSTDPAAKAASCHHHPFFIQPHKIKAVS